MIMLQRTDSKHSEFIALVKELDAYLKITDGDEHDFYNQFNGIEQLNHVKVAYINDVAVGCGAFKAYNSTSVEIKRMFTSPSARSKGVASKILNELENWASELNFQSAVLETGKRQIEAVNFYKKCDYRSIPKYGQYKDMDNSLCFEKKLMKNEKG
jgi:putative acetyltransferase